MISYWSLSDSKSPQVSKTLLSILADLNNALFGIVSTRPLISKSSSPFINPLVTVPCTPITIGITVIFMFHSFFSSLARSRYLSHFSFFYSLLCDHSEWQSPLLCRFSLSLTLSLSLSLLTFTRSGCLTEPEWTRER